MLRLKNIAIKINSNFYWFDFVHEFSPLKNRLMRNKHHPQL